MSDTNTNRQVFTEVGGVGFRVDRDAATLPQGVDGALFTISGGRVLLTSIIGEVTVEIETQANNTKLKLNPTATGVDQDLCAVLSITADAVGELYTISGVVGDALRSDLLIGLNSLLGAGGMILSEGDIELDCAASNTGEIKWTLFYLPIDTGAVIEVA